MATINVYSTGPGDAWSRAAQLFYQYATGIYSSFAYALSTEFPWRALNVTVGVGAGTDLYHIVVPGIGQGGQVPFAGILNSPGWRTMPQWMPAIIGGANTEVEWRNKMAAMRADILTTWGGASTPGWVERSGSGSYGLNWVHFYSQFTDRELVSLDASLIYVSSTGFTLDEYDGAPVDSQASGSNTSMVAGSSTAGLQGLVEAVQDIAFRDVDVSFNNGDTIYSARGGVRV